MARRRPGPDRIFRFDDVEVRAGPCVIVRHGRPRAIEPKAMAVLVELLVHPGATVTREALLDRVWGHRHVTPGVLNRVIAQLRRVLGDDAGHPRCIRTVHGLGYRFVRPVEEETPATLGELAPDGLLSGLPPPATGPLGPGAGQPLH